MNKEPIVITYKHEQLTAYYKQGYKLIQAISHTYYDSEINKAFYKTEYILELINMHA